MGPVIKSPPSNAGGTGSISDQGTTLPHAKRCEPPPKKRESPNVQTLDGGSLSTWDVLKPGVGGGGIHGQTLEGRCFPSGASGVSLKNPVHRGSWWATVYTVTKMGHN